MSNVLIEVADVLVMLLALAVFLAGVAIATHGFVRLVVWISGDRTGDEPEDNQREGK